ncbi:hypothetical protein AB4Z39_28320 [Mycobacterium adipatum]|jgi:hypothetical protein|uniref:hypothetical protein n=1 Tax=Mycobacterium adipatum TaxID=1682113 RepID=UPI0034E066E1
MDAGSKHSIVVVGAEPVTAEEPSATSADRDAREDEFQRAYQAEKARWVELSARLK